MKANLLFNLDNPEDAMAHLRCVKSLDMALALWTFAGKIRSFIDTSEDGKYIDGDAVYDAWNEVMEEYDINLNKLIE
jgi:hypothetical protein